MTREEIEAIMARAQQMQQGEMQPLPMPHGQNPNNQMQPLPMPHQAEQETMQPMPNRNSPQMPSGMQGGMPRPAPMPQMGSGQQPQMTMEMLRKFMQMQQAQQAR